MTFSSLFQIFKQTGRPGWVKFVYSAVQAARPGFTQYIDLARLKIPSGPSSRPLKISWTTESRRARHKADWAKVLIFHQCSLPSLQSFWSVSQKWCKFIKLLDLRKADSQLSLVRELWCSVAKKKIPKIKSWLSWIEFRFICIELKAWLSYRKFKGKDHKVFESVIPYTTFTRNQFTRNQNLWNQQDINVWILEYYPIKLQDQNFEKSSWFR